MKRTAFTLIEVMIAVVIISVVIMALIQMFANNNHTFHILKEQTKVNQYASLLIANDIYGFENKTIYLDDLVSDFRISDELRRKLKNVKTQVLYKKLETLDMKEEDSEGSSSLVFEVGQSVLKMDDTSVSLFRLQLQ